MNVYSLAALATSLQLVVRDATQCEDVAKVDGPGTVFDDADYALVIEAIDTLYHVCKNYRFEDAALKVTLSFIRMKPPNPKMNVSALGTELTNIYEAVVKDLAIRRFIQVSIGRNSCIDNPKLLGDAVADRFRNAVPDIIDAGNCLAAECSTAAVFHLMRVVEHGIRSFGKHLGVRRLESVKKKTGVKQYTPLKFSQWETILNGFPARIERRLKKLRPGPVKQGWQDFYQFVLLDINAIRDVWRNHVMHARLNCTPADAEAVRVRVEAIMQKLATRVREV